MTVFAVTFKDLWDDSFRIEGIFSSEEKAKKYIRDRIEEVNSFSKKYLADCLDISSYEVK